MNFLWGSQPKAKPSNLSPEQSAQLQEMVRQHIERLQAQGIKPPNLMEQQEDNLNTAGGTTSLIQQQFHQQMQQQQQTIIDQDDYQEQPQTPSYISTTAGGDGLEFDNRLSSVFQEIADIKLTLQERAFIEVRKYLQNDNEGLTLEEVPKDTVKPCTILLEAIENLEVLKVDMQGLRNREEEYLNVLKSIEGDKEVSTCSHTLNLLINAWQEQNKENETLNLRLEELKNENHNIFQDLSHQRVDRNLMQNEIIRMQNEINHYQGEKSKLNQEIDKYKRIRLEQMTMHHEESVKAIIDTQVYKDKVEKYKMEIHQLRKVKEELSKFESLYKEIKEREDSRIQKVYEEAAKMQKVQQNETLSIFGHIKEAANNDNSTTIFSIETASFLENRDLVKLLCLSKKFTQTLLSSNPRIYFQVFNLKSNIQSSQLNDLRTLVDTQKDQLKKLETKDQLRKSISQDTSEDKMRYILEKHVVKPKILESNPMLKEMNEFKVTEEMLRCIQNINTFMGKYFESVKQVQLAQRNKMLQQSLVRQQLSNQHQVQTILASTATQEQNKNKPPGYNIVKAGKKLVGAFSYFGGFTGATQQQSVAQPTQLQQPQSDKKESDLLGMLDKPTGENINESEQPTIDDQDTLPTSDQSKSDLSEETKEVQSQITAQLANLDELRKFDDNQGAYDHIDVQSIQVTDATMSTLQEQLQSADEMNEFLYKIGCCFVGNKSQLALWIKGIQEAFAELYVVSKQLYLETQELETLKDFLVSTVEHLKLRLQDLINDKEDMNAIHQSDSNVKEHLIGRVNELEQVNMERSTELHITRRNMQAMIDEKAIHEQQALTTTKELNDFKVRAKKELKFMKDQASKISNENHILTQAVLSMRQFFDKVNQDY